MTVLSGKEVSAASMAKTARGCMLFERRFSRKPMLAVVLVGDDPASQTYVKNKKKACDEVLISHRDHVLPSTATQKELAETIDSLNWDAGVDGILVQLPLPGQMDESLIMDMILPEKDVDGFHPQNMGRLLLGRKTMVACTPKGILEMLDYYGIQTMGRDVCIVGRSNIVGKPLAALLIQKDRGSTVTICNSMTCDLASHTGRADILVSAVGKPSFITGEMVKDGAVVIDVGINRVADPGRRSGYRLQGDVDFDSVAKKAGAITPVPGGVGPMTIAMLLENTLICACRREGIDVDDLTGSADEILH